MTTCTYYIGDTRAVTRRRQEIQWPTLGEAAA